MQTHDNSNIFNYAFIPEPGFSISMITRIQWLISGFMKRNTLNIDRKLLKDTPYRTKWITQILYIIAAATTSVSWMSYPTMTTGILLCQIMILHKLGFGYIYQFTTLEKYMQVITRVTDWTGWRIPNCVLRLKGLSHVYAALSLIVLLCSLDQCFVSVVWTMDIS